MRVYFAEIERTIRTMSDADVRNIASVLKLSGLDEDEALFFAIGAPLTGLLERIETGNCNDVSYASILPSIQAIVTRMNNYGKHVTIEDVCDILWIDEDDLPIQEYVDFTVDL